MTMRVTTPGRESLASPGEEITVRLYRPPSVQREQGLLFLALVAAVLVVIAFDWFRVPLFGALFSLMITPVSAGVFQVLSKVAAQWEGRSTLSLLPDAIVFGGVKRTAASFEGVVVIETKGGGAIVLLTPVNGTPSWLMAVATREHAEAIRSRIAPKGPGVLRFRVRSSRSSLVALASTLPCLVLTAILPSFSGSWYSVGVSFLLLLASAMSLALLVRDAMAYNYLCVDEREVHWNGVTIPLDAHLSMVRKAAGLMLHNEGADQLSVTMYVHPGAKPFTLDQPELIRRCVEAVTLRRDEAAESAPPES
jgi:hypothetical protein